MKVWELMERLSKCCSGSEVRIASVSEECETILNERIIDTCDETTEAETDFFLNIDLPAEMAK